MPYRNKLQSAIKTILLLMFIINIISCKRPSHSEYPVVPANQILSSPDDLVRYWNQYMKLGEDFQSLDTNGKSIPNRDFLRLLASKKYLPMRLESANDSLYYQLYRIDSTESNDFGEIVMAYTNSYYQNYLRRGERFPDFNYVDLNGDRYDSQKLKGKTVIIKFWFINCVSCIKEMPAINELQKKYRDRKDIIFLSLAFDPEKDLRKFLTKTQFNIPVIQAKEDYIEKTLKVNSFPTIMVINKQGVIARVFDGVDGLKSYCQKL